MSTSASQCKCMWSIVTTHLCVSKLTYNVSCPMLNPTIQYTIHQCYLLKEWLSDSFLVEIISDVSV